MRQRDPKPILHRTLVDGVQLAWAEWGREQDPLLLFAHATGFHGRCWDQVIRDLDGYRVIALDHRGHGRSSSKPPFTWEQFGHDVAEFVVALDLHDIGAVGHSMGGHSLIQAAAKHAGRFSQLTLIDPVVLEPRLYGEEQSLPAAMDAVARRRSSWDSPRQMFEKLGDRIPFSRWHSDVLWDYCENGLVRNGDEYQLACAPQIEARIYRGMFDVDIFASVSKVAVPVSVVRAEWTGLEAAMQDFSASPTWPELASAFSNGHDIYLPEYSHFMPMEDPARIAAIIDGVAARMDDHTIAR